MENHLDAIGPLVEELAPADAGEHRVLLVVDNIVGGDWRGAGVLSRIYATLQLGQVVSGEQLRGVWYKTSQTLVIQSLPHVFLNDINCVLQTLCNGMPAQRFNIEAVGLGREDHEGHHGDVRARGLEQVVQTCQRFNEDVGPLVGELIPAGSEEIEGAVEVEVEMAVEVSAHKLVDLLLARRVQVLELVQIPFHIEPVGGDQVRLSLHKMSRLHTGDLRHSGEYVRQVRARPLNAISMVDPSLSRFHVTVEILEIVVEVGVAGAEVSAQLGGMRREDRCNVRLPQPELEQLG